MTLSESALIAALLSFLRTGDDVERRAQTLATHGVALLVSNVLASELTSREHEALRAVAAPYVVATLRADAAQQDVAALFREADIDYVLLKGSALAACWRSVCDADLRLYTDVDVLVRPSRYGAARAACMAAGFIVAEQSAGETSLLRADGAAVDLHWMPLNDAAASRRWQVSADVIFQEHAIAADTGYLLDPVMTLLHTVGHALISDLSKTSALVDVYAVASQPDLDWDEVVDVSQRHSMGLAVATALVRVAPWLPMPGIDGIVRRLAPRSPWLMLARVVGRRSPVEYLDGHWSGGEFYRHTRTGTVTSVASLAGSVPENLRVQRQLRRRPA